MKDKQLPSLEEFMCDDGREGRAHEEDFAFLAEVRHVRLIAIKLHTEFSSSPCLVVMELH